MENKAISASLFTMRIQAPTIAKLSYPGQFVNLYFENDVKIFPRPFSISEIDGDIIFIRYKIIGSQTKKMSKWQNGERVKILGPLGNSFAVDQNIKSHILIGGGIGIAPLFYLRDYIKKYIDGIYFFAGAANKSEHFKYSKRESKNYLATDDGGVGFHGNVVELFKKNYSELPKPAVIYGCGPEPMLKSLKIFGQKNDIEVQLSMEKIMGCGNGLCQGCAIPTEDHIDSKYLLVCKDGPVFKAKDIIIDG